MRGNEIKQLYYEASFCLENQDLGIVFYEKLPDFERREWHGEATVITALIKQSRKLPSELYKSLTWDRGKEMCAH